MIKNASIKNKIKLFLVDDDSVYLKSLEIDFLSNADFIIEKFNTGEECLANLSQSSDVVVLDYHLDVIGSNSLYGIETLDRIKAFNSDIPVIMLSSQNKIDVAVNFMHHRVFDYIVKSETTFMRVQININTIFSYKRMEKELSGYMNKNLFLRRKKKVRQGRPA